MKQFRKSEEKKTIPWQLEKEIMRVRIDEDMTWDGACIRIAAMVNKTQLPKLVQEKAEELGKSRFFASLNTARETIRREAEASAKEAVRKFENNFHLPCAKGCSTPIYFSDRNANWYTEIYPVLEKALRWNHTTCP
jgi:hypothetical protein